MNTIRDALAQYVAVRRALGTQFREPAHTLGHFVDFLELEGAEFITISLALRWAMERKDVQRATWARRLTMVSRRWLVEHIRSPNGGPAKAAVPCSPPAQ